MESLASVWVKEAFMLWKGTDNEKKGPIKTFYFVMFCFVLFFLIEVRLLM